MKKLFIFILCFIIAIGGYSFWTTYSWVSRSSGSIVVVDGQLAARNAFFQPLYFDTTAANTVLNSPGLDTCGALIFTYLDNTTWQRTCNPKQWQKIGIIPTWQQTLDVTNGGLLTKTDTIDIDGHNLLFVNGATDLFRLDGTGNFLYGTDAYFADGNITLSNHFGEPTISLEAVAGAFNVQLSAPNSSGDFHIYIPNIVAYTGLDGIGTLASRVNQTTADNSGTVKIKLIDSIWRTPGVDSIYFRQWRLDNSVVTKAIKDSIGSGGGGGGTVTAFSFTNGGGFTGTVTNSTTTPTLSLVLQNAAANGSTKGQATFRAFEFNDDGNGLISLDTTVFHTSTYNNFRYLQNITGYVDAGFGLIRSGTGVIGDPYIFDLDTTNLPFYNFPVKQPLQVIDGGSNVDTLTLGGLSSFGSVGQAMRVAADGISLEWYTPSGSGTVTSFTFTDGSGFDGTVTNSTTTPTLSLTTTISNTQLIYSNSGALAGNSGLTFVSGTGLLTAPKMYLNSATDNGGNDGALLVERALVGTGNAHSIRIHDDFNRPGYSFGVFDDASTMTSENNGSPQHHASFQLRPTMQFTGTLNELIGLSSVATINAGATVSNFMAVDVNTLNGAGTATNVYGIRVRDQTLGTNVFPIYVETQTNSATHSWLKNTTWVTNGYFRVGNTEPITIDGTDNGAVYPSIGYNWNPVTDTYISTDYIHRIQFNGAAGISLQVGGTNSAGSTPSWITTFTTVNTSSTLGKTTTFGYGDFKEIALPATPSSGFGRLYVNSSDSKIHFVDDGGTDYDLTSGGGGSPGGLTTQVQYNSSGSFAGAAGFTFNGTATVTLGVAGTSLGVLKLTGNTSGTVTLNTAAAAGTYTLTLPTDDGTSGQFLTTDGSGGLSWTTSSGSVTINSNGVDRIITGSNSANTLNGGADFTFNRSGAGDEVKHLSPTNQNYYTFHNASGGSDGFFFYNSTTLSMWANGIAGLYVNSAGHVGVRAVAPAGTDFYVQNAVNGEDATVTIYSMGTGGSGTLNLVSTAGDTRLQYFAASNGINYIQSANEANNGNKPLKFTGVTGGQGSTLTLSFATTNIDKDVTIGIDGSSQGTLGIAGATGGTATLKVPASFTSYNFNLPSTAGTSGYLLTSGGGGSTAMTWTNPATFIQQGSNTLSSNFTLAGASGVYSFTANSLSAWTLSSSVGNGGLAGVDITIAASGTLALSGATYTIAGVSSSSADKILVWNSSNNQIGYRTTADIQGTLFTQTSTQTIAATTTPTSLFSSGVGSNTIGAATAIVGKQWRLKIRGVYSTPALSVGNLTFDIKLGSVIIATGTANSLVAASTNLGFEAECIVTCRSTGATGTVMTTGSLKYDAGTSNVAQLNITFNNSATTSTIDFTASNAFDCIITWSNNTAGNSISSLNYSLEALN